MQVQNLLNYLKELGIEYTLFEHEPVFTAQEGQHLKTIISGAHTKNLFLKDKSKSYFLVSVLEHKRVDLKKLSKQIYAKDRLSFASAEDLKSLLDLNPGSVTGYGLINDKEKIVKYILDKEILNYDLVNFHPLVNDKTLSVKTVDFLIFLKAINHEPEIINVPTV